MSNHQYVVGRLSQETTNAFVDEVHTRWAELLMFYHTTSFRNRCQQAHKPRLSPLSPTTTTPPPPSPYHHQALASLVPPASPLRSTNLARLPNLFNNLSNNHPAACQRPRLHPDACRAAVCGPPTFMEAAVAHLVAVPGSGLGKNSISEIVG